MCFLPCKRALNLSKHPTLITAATFNFATTTTTTNTTSTTTTTTTTGV
jgi:hypothetical protein